MDYIAASSYARHANTIDSITYTYPCTLTTTGGIKSTNSIIEKESGKHMETLFEVIVVSEKGSIVVDTKVVAKSEESAKYQSSANTHNPDTHTIIVRNLGAVKIKEEEKKK